MRLHSVNAAQTGSLVVGRQTVATAIDKRPVAGSTRISAEGVAGDEQADSRFHGGRDQAVYVYSLDDYDWWSEQLGRDLLPGLFGENLTIEGLPDDLNIGDRLLIGNVVLEVSAPRLPCAKLSAVMEDSEFGQIFINAERPGAYCRVLAEGNVSVDDTVSLVSNSGESMTIKALFRLCFNGSPDSDSLRRALQTPLADRLRSKFQRRLEKT